MDASTQYLASVLDGTLNPDKATREAAEAALGQVFLSDGCTVAFLGLLAPSVDKKYRQSIGINVKNNIRAIWTNKNGSQQPKWCISDAEKQNFRDKMIDYLLVESDYSVRSIIAETLRTIAEIDFPRTQEDPNNWPDLVPKLIAALSSEDFLTIYNSLYLYRKLVKSLQYKKAENREVLDYLIAESFPTIQARLSQCVSMNQPEVAHILRISMKIFHSAVLFSLPGSTRNPVTNKLVPLTDFTHPIIDYNLWFEVMMALLAKKLPEASENEEPTGQPTDKEDRKQWHWWKVKKWCSRIFLHFQNRYGIVTNVSEDFEPLARFFTANYLDNCLKTCMQLLLEKSQGAHLTDEVFRNCVATVTNCVDISSSFKLLIKDNIDFLLFQVVFPTLLLGEEDIEAFNEEPAVFIRNMECAPEDWIDPRSSCVTLLQKLASNRQKYSLPIILAQIQSVLADYSAADEGSRNYQLKDGAINVISLLFETFNKSKDYKALAEPFIVHHIVPELQSSVPFMRFRACWSIEMFPRNMRKNTGVIKTAGVPTQICQALITLLQSDPQAATQAKAATAIQAMMVYPEVKEFLKPHIKLLVGEYFRIMSLVENDNILSALQSIVHEFEDCIGEIALDMTASLCQIFVRYYNDDTNEDDDDDYSSMYASETLQTILHIASSLYDQKDVLASLEQYLAPLIRLILDNGQSNEYKSYEFCDNACDLTYLLTNYSKTISPDIWLCVGSMMTAVVGVEGSEGWAFDFAAEMCDSLLNCMRRDMLTFLKTEGFVALFFSFVQKLITYDCQAGQFEMEWNLALELLTTFTIECKPFPQTQYIFTDPANPFENIGTILAQTPELTEVEGYEEEIKSEITLYLSSVTELTAYAPQIAQTYFPSMIDSCFPFLLDARREPAINDRGENENAVRRNTKIRAHDLILAMLYVDASSTLAMLHGAGRLDSFFNSLFLKENLENTDRSMSQRAAVMGLSNVISLCAVDPSAYPPIIRDNLLSMIKHVISECKGIVSDENDEEDEEDDDESYNDDEEGEDEGFDEDADAVDQNWADYQKKLDVTAADVNAAMGEPVDAEDEEIGSEAFPSGLFRIDPAIYFCDAMSALPADVAQSVVQALASEPNSGHADSHYAIFQAMSTNLDVRKYKILSRFIYQ